MVKRFSGVLAALCIMLSCSLSSAYASTLRFVDSHDDLVAALDEAEHGTIGSVAVATTYYQEGTSKTQKAQIRALMQTVFEHDRAVYLYGQSLSEELVGELLDVEIFCAPAYAIGLTTKKAACLVKKGNMTEEDMRKGLERLEQLREAQHQ